MSKDNQTNIGLDGYPRRKEEDERISMDIASLFSTPSGQQVRHYLKSITIEAVHGPAVTDEVLRHAEGQRYIVGLIDRRINHASRMKQNG